jgi:hypothetical protein
LTQPAPSIDALRRAASGGDARAQAVLGETLLHAGTGPADFAEAEAAIQAAVRGGDAEAAAMLAMLTTVRRGSGQAWPEAIGLLAIAAERGSERARGQLLALASPTAAAEASDDRWDSLARSVDLGDWSGVAGYRLLSTSPRVGMIEGFLSPAICDWLIGRARDRTQRAPVYDPQTGGPNVVDFRSNTAFEFLFADLDVVMALVRAKIAATLGTPPIAMEPPQVLHYAVGQRFALHHDYLDAGEAGYEAELRRIGQRSTTFLVYLNDAFEGGETHFPRLPLRVKAPRGGALFFDNLDAAGQPDPRTLHAGLAPTSGEKWLLSQWVRTPPPA